MAFSRSYKDKYELFLLVWMGCTVKVIAISLYKVVIWGTGIKNLKKKKLNRHIGGLFSIDWKSFLAYNCACSRPCVWACLLICHFPLLMQGLPGWFNIHMRAHWLVWVHLCVLSMYPCVQVFTCLCTHTCVGGCGLCVDRCMYAVILVAVIGCTACSLAFLIGTHAVRWWVNRETENLGGELRLHAVTLL